MVHRRILLLTVLLFVSGVGAQADPIDDFVAAQMQQFHVPGLTLVVVKKGEIVKARGYGLANVAQKIPAAPETVYKMARSASSSSPRASCCWWGSESSGSTIPSANTSTERRLPGARSRSGIC